MNLFFYMFVVSILLKQNVQCYEEEDVDFEAEICETTATDEIQDISPNDEWTTMALKNIAYYLRYHKFNEWDRRIHQDEYLNVRDNDTYFYRSFPDPPLKTLHWRIRENCDIGFYNCIKYINIVISTAPLTRSEDTTTILNENLHYSSKDEYIQQIDTHCKQLLVTEQVSGSPFESTFEKFQWRTSASYYMCYYTMLGTPDLSMLGEPCDNFANCLDPKYGNHNSDARADDRLPFACAVYSFCPDPCCPLKHIKIKTDCLNLSNNPCFIENHEGSNNDRVCVMHKNNNQNMKDLIANKWNITCNCKEKGFTWKPQCGMCVDVNECLIGKHDCVKTSEDCLNLPGSYHCICKWGFSFHKLSMKCTQNEKIQLMFLDT